MSDALDPLPLRVEGIFPILRVRSLKTSIAWYVGVLGFREDWHRPGIMASVSHDRRPILLRENAQGAPRTWVWVGVNDARLWHDRAASRGARILMPLRNFSWALEFHVEDPDGHVLRIGSEPLEDQPLDEWPGSAT